MTTHDPISGQPIPKDYGETVERVQPARATYVQKPSRLHHKTIKARMRASSLPANHDVTDSRGMPTRGFNGFRKMGGFPVLYFDREQATLDLLQSDAIVTGKRTVLGIQLEHPIVLAHGLFGFRSIEVGRLTLASYFRGLPDSLRAAGNRVYVSKVPPIAGIKDRARELAREIDLAFPGQAVHVIGHSMGGLDARHLLSDSQWQGRILSLTTIGSPHHGSALADAAREHVGPVYKALRSLKINHRGFWDITKRAARAVNRSTCRISNVPCFCVAGDPRDEEVSWPLRPLHSLLKDLEGPNDGLVSVESARGFGRPLPNWPIDHFAQTNWITKPLKSMTSRQIGELYMGLLENLADNGMPARRVEYPEFVPSRIKRRIMGSGGFLGFGFPGLDRGVQKHRHGHVAEDIRSGPASVEEPIHRQEHWDLVGGKLDRREDQRQGHKTS